MSPGDWDNLFLAPSREPEAGAVKGVVYIDKAGYNPVIHKAIGRHNMDANSLSRFYNEAVIICDNFHQNNDYGDCTQRISANGDDEAQLIPHQLGWHLIVCLNCWCDLNDWYRGKLGRRMEYDAEGRVRIVTRLPDA